jgi:hypothetical protein
MQAAIRALRRQRLPDVAAPPAAGMQASVGSNSIARWCDRG